MSSRIPNTSLIRSLFACMPAESGLTDAQIVAAHDTGVPHKTFSRLRTRPPERITLRQLLMICRLTAAVTGFDTSEILSIVRDGFAHADHPLRLLVDGKVVARQGKDANRLADRCDRLASQARHILLFDRGDSFGCLRPGSSAVAGHGLPKVGLVCTKDSLDTRFRNDGDSGIEPLLNHIDREPNSIAIVNDSPAIRHRIFRSVYAEAQAVAIFDRSVMVVLPGHGRTWRVYDLDAHPRHGLHITAAINAWRRMRLFSEPSESGVRRQLRSYLSYRLPDRQTPIALAG